MKHIDTLIEAKTFWSSIPDDARDAIVDAFYILYGSYGFGNNDQWMKDISDDAITAAANNITLNAEKFIKYSKYIEIVADMLNWDMERLNFFRNTLKMYKLNKLQEGIVIL